MQFRESINSESLQKKFPAVYREFFGKSNLVVSGHLQFPWFSNNISKYTLGRIYHKLPLKVYIGFEKNNKNTLVFQEYTEFNSDLMAIEEHNVLLPELNSEAFIKELCQKTGITSDYTISILAESILGKGFSEPLYETMANKWTKRRGAH